MSWAEVKKINSDLDKPLDKLMGENYWLRVEPFNVSDDSKLTEVLNVSGSGEIICIPQIALYSNEQIKIEVDGEVIVDITNISDTRSFFILLAREDLKLMPGTALSAFSTVYFQFQKGSRTEARWMSFAFNLNATPIINQTPNGDVFFPTHSKTEFNLGNYTFVCLSDKKIKFRKSLKVWTKMTSTSPGGINYSLTE